MKLFVLSLTLAVAVSAVPKLGVKSPEWKDFKSKYGKVYHDNSVEQERLSIYLENKNLVDQHNAAKNATFQMELNGHADLTPAEFNSNRKGYNAKLNPTNLQSAAPAPKVAAATSIDWRTLGAVTPVKNQGQCGSCWSFSATGALEGQNFRKTGKLVSLSEQNLVDCSNVKPYNNGGCNGGSMTQAFLYVKNNGGDDTEASYPYKAVQGPCKFSKTNVGGTDTGYATVAAGSESALMAAVSAYGPVSVAIDASKKSFQLYKSGIYYEPTCSSSSLDHGVLVVGYGTDSTGAAYWIVKNSWGTSWGENGYIRMARNRNNNCGIATSASYPLV